MSDDDERVIADLQRRLEDAEGVVDAFRTGSVDAVVVDTAGGPRVYTLESPDQPYRAFVERMRDGAVTVDERHTIVYCNESFAGMLGRPLEQVIGARLDDLLTDDCGDRFAELMAQAKTGSAVADCTLRAGDSSVPVSMSVSKLPGVAPAYYGMTVTDLTERKRIEALEAAHAAAITANRARDQFLAVVSHELRTPLNAILGWAQLLGRASGLDDKTRQGFRVIERNARAQAQLINDLLDVSRMLAGRLRLDMKPMHLREALQGALDAVGTVAEAKHVLITTSGDTGPIVGDIHRVQQVIWNLLSNAVKASDPGGTVYVTLREAGGRAVLEVRDEGRGIPAEFLPHMFRVFTQLDSSSTRPSGGLGLGLSIVKELTELHGGTVTVRSDGPGMGATFTVTLPLAAAQPVRRRQSETPPGPVGIDLSGLEILLVEDDDDARELIAEIAGKYGCVVHLASSGAEALETLEKRPVDLLVSDIAMPDMDGYELIRRIRAGGRSARELPAVALTAFARAEDRRRALLAGFQVHVSKPVEGDELVALLHSLSGRTLADQR